MAARYDALPPNLPPRCLAREAAAAYLGICPDVFDRLVKDGTLPQPLRWGERRVVWDLAALNRRLDELSGLTAAAAAPAKAAIMEAIRAAR